MKARHDAIAKLRDSRDQSAVAAAIAAVERTATDGGNLMPVILEAVERYATLGEIADAMRRVFGEYR